MKYSKYENWLYVAETEGHILFTPAVLFPVASQNASFFTMTVVVKHFLSETLERNYVHKRLLQTLQTQSAHFPVYALNASVLFLVSFSASTWRWSTKTLSDNNNNNNNNNNENSLRGRIILLKDAFALSMIRGKKKSTISDFNETWQKWWCFQTKHVPKFWNKTDDRQKSYKEKLV